MLDLLEDTCQNLPINIFSYANDRFEVTGIIGIFTGKLMFISLPLHK